MQCCRTSACCVSPHAFGMQNLFSGAYACGLDVGPRVLSGFGHPPSSLRPCSRKEKYLVLTTSSTRDLRINEAPQRFHFSTRDVYERIRHLVSTSLISIALVLRGWVAEWAWIHVHRVLKKNHFHASCDCAFQPASHDPSHLQCLVVPAFSTCHYQPCLFSSSSRRFLSRAVSLISIKRVFEVVSRPSLSKWLGTHLGKRRLSRWRRLTASEARCQKSWHTKLHSWGCPESKAP
ncbi:uncharacterized protein IWZ02DRAFT_166286 [Phyllosticta citriasiana]|uniref:uncharacterized protein n=1 Tax=Phyllosticta citriasiana TaxID=595635 RepID=UPI0030FD3D12